MGFKPDKLVWLVGVVLAGPALAAPTSETDQHIRAIESAILQPVLVRGESRTWPTLADRMAQEKVPGLSIAVIHQGRIEWARGYGVTKLGGPAVTPNTLFQAASISKPVFALGVLHLVDAGKLNLDTNVNEYLKTWKVPDNEFTKDRKVTLQGILSHSAGLTVHGFPGYASGERLPTTVQILDGTAPANTGAIRVDVVPGTINRYSGGGYVVAQQLLTDVTGVPLPKLMHDSVLAPLGMKLSTYEQPLPASRLKEVALPYRGDGSAVAGGPHTYAEMAPAGLWTTPSDLARYSLGVQAALAGKSKNVISAQTARAMLTPVIRGQGIGPQVGGVTARKYFTHGGANEGYRCVLVSYTDGEGAVVMTNSDNGGGLGYEVIRTIAHEYGWPDFAPAEYTLTTIAPEQLDRYVGAYESKQGQPLVVQKDDDRLTGQIIGGVPMLLEPTSDTQFFVRALNILVTFTSGEGHATSATIREYGQDRIVARVDDARAQQLTATVDAIAKRVEDQRRMPGSEAAARELIAGLASGNPNYDHMSPEFADNTRSQISMLQKLTTGFGTLRSLTFKNVAPDGSDVYDAVFDSQTTVLTIRLTDAGRIDSAWMSW